MRRSRPRCSRPLRIALLVFAGALAACTSSDLGVTQPMESVLAVKVVLGDSAVARVLDLETLHLMVRDASGAVVLESTVGVPTGAESVETDLRLPPGSMPSGTRLQEAVVLTAALADGAGHDDFVAGPDTVQSMGGGATTLVTLQPRYVGVGSDAVAVRIGPADTTVFANTTLVLTATALDAAGQAIPGTPVLWTSSDIALATLEGGGGAVGRMQVRATTAGTVQIIARLVTGAADTATVEVMARPGCPGCWDY